MILYHGTRLEKETIVKEGLKRPDYNRLINEVLARYGYTRKQVPEWTWKNELDYRLEEYKQFSPEFQPYLAFTLSYQQAEQYAWMGGEFEYLLIYNLFLWKASNSEGITSLDAQRAREKAVRGRGIMKVVTIDIPQEYIPKLTLEKIEKLKSISYDPYDRRGTWNIPLFRDVPPEWIMRVDEVNLNHIIYESHIEEHII